MSRTLVPSETDALAAWAAQVVAEREQIERLREEPPRQDHYAPLATMFKADPRRTDEESLPMLLEQVGPDWFDPGEYLGKTEAYTWYSGCWEGVHLHQDHYNYNHYAKWTDKAWIGSTLNQTTAIGFLGESGGQGPDGHGGSWTGW